eukprot:gnl/TRDRNA2_/TRDRNA2_197257_c0_seq1.p1 gnl/TRDRNA2_/TRDRNA2_197257_c0~~gnl/TRDRNA2_/TRDRNA2_197257_c0_seq1.p1  ORF type:complete len:418 (+),score=57.77 gnl/TRDRNA2_/TRDRNA2_197257_c0_seq1:83-1336(+)
MRFCHRAVDLMEAPMPRGPLSVGVLLWTMWTPYVVHAAWEMGENGAVNCWNTKVLLDVAEGWEDNCLGLEAKHTLGDEASCKDQCWRDVGCPVWQWNNGSRYWGCWWGYGDRRCRGGAPRMRDNGKVTGGQRLQHGIVRIRANLHGVEAFGLFDVGKYHDGDTKLALNRCKALCYSDVHCTIWLYGQDGCWVERSPRYKFDGRLKNNTPWARTMLGGEIVEHWCPERPKKKKKSAADPLLARVGVEVSKDSPTRLAYWFVGAAALFLGVVCIVCIAIRCVGDIVKTTKRRTMSRSRSYRSVDDAEMEQQEDARSFASNSFEDMQQQERRPLTTQMYPQPQNSQQQMPPPRMVSFTPSSAPSANSFAPSAGSRGSPHRVLSVGQHGVLSSTPSYAVPAGAQPARRVEMQRAMGQAAFR